MTDRLIVEGASDGHEPEDERVRQAAADYYDRHYAQTPGRRTRDLLWKLMSREGEDGFGWVVVLEGPLLEADGDVIEVVPASEVERLERVAGERMTRALNAEDELTRLRELLAARPEAYARSTMESMVERDEARAEAERLQRELARAVETRENANTVSVRVEGENRRLRQQRDQASEALKWTLNGLKDHLAGRGIPAEHIISFAETTLSDVSGAVDEGEAK